MTGSIQFYKLVKDIMDIKDKQHWSVLLCTGRMQN